MSNEVQSEAEYGFITFVKSNAKAFLTLRINNARPAIAGFAPCRGLSHRRLTIEKCPFYGISHVICSEAASSSFYENLPSPLPFL
jgi:hypothetical protein